MKIKIIHRWTNKVIYECEKSSLKEAVIKAASVGADLQGAYLRGADLQGAYLRGAYLQGADLRGADLQGAYLRGAKEYYDLHDVCFEVIRRQKKEEITKSEWSMIGEMTIHRFCWGEIKNKWRN